MLREFETGALFRKLQAVTPVTNIQWRRGGRTVHWITSVCLS